MVEGPERGRPDAISDPAAKTPRHGAERCTEVAVRSLVRIEEQSGHRLGAGAPRVAAGELSEWDQLPRTHAVPFTKR